MTMHTTQAALYLTSVDIPEEEKIAARSFTLKQFVTRIIEYGQVILMICINFLNYISLTRADEFIFLFNQLLDCNKTMNGKLYQKVYATKIL